jgi:hypothetical protein
VFYLSGAINALLLLIARPQLLLLTRPKVNGQPETQHAPQSHGVNGQPEMELTPRRTGNTANEAVSDTPHNPEPTATAILDAGSSNNTAITRISSQVSRLDVREC